MKKRYKFLRTLANIFKIIGVLVTALSLLGGIISIVLAFGSSNIWGLFGYDAASGAAAGFSLGVSVLLGGVLSGMIIYGYGELIFVFLSIEANTYKTSLLLEEMQEEEK